MLVAQSVSYLGKRAAAAAGPPAPYGSHRYWFLAIAANAGGSATSLTEIEFLDGDGNVISTAGGTAFASGFLGAGNEPSKAFDGNASSSWAVSGTTNVYIGMDFGAGNNKAVASVRIRGDATSDPDRSPGEWALRYADAAVTAITDGTAAFSAKSKWWVQSEQRTFPGDELNKRAWRLLILGVNGGTNTLNYEMELRATAGGADQVPALSTTTGNSNGNTARAIGSVITLGGNEGFRCFDNNTGTTWFATGSANNWIGAVVPGGISVGEVALWNPADSRTPRNTRLQYWDETTQAWVQQGSDYDWGGFGSAFKTHSY